MQSEITESNVYELSIETTRLLNESQDKLGDIEWTNGEANIDTDYSELACYCCRIAWDRMIQKNPEYTEISFSCRIPDINILFTYTDGRKIKHKIELKSSKSRKMPGSTIKNLDINQPLIYCLRPISNTGAYLFKCSQYHSAMGESNIDLFQDRTPRPVINFDKMIDALPYESKDKDCWIEHYAKCGLNRIDKTIRCNKSWQDDMIKIMKKNILSEYIRNTSEEQFKIDKINI
jgi:hypothetical protein